MTLHDLKPSQADNLDEVLRGLASRPKHLPSKFFYDDRGSQLFEEICELDEYYLTRTELAIMRRDAGEMAAMLGPQCLLVELGSGASVKTRLLLDNLVDAAGYVPVDISRDHLEATAAALNEDYPQLEVAPVCADFAVPFAIPEVASPVARRVVYFPGSTIGNFDPGESVALFRHIRRLAGPGGGLLIGIDLKKDPALLHAAYNDARGVTAQFNLNLLARINRELGADFDLAQFRHRAFYDADAGRIEMHLESQSPQKVQIGGQVVALAKGETIRTEYSYKYTLDGFAALAESAGLVVERSWMDRGEVFAVLLLGME